MTITNETRIEALKEASISIACCLDEVSEVTREDLEHIQSQLCILENYEDEEEVRNRKMTKINKEMVEYWLDDNHGKWIADVLVDICNNENDIIIVKKEIHKAWQDHLE